MGIHRRQRAKRTGIFLEHLEERSLMSATLGTVGKTIFVDFGRDPTVGEFFPGGGVNLIVHWGDGKTSRVVDVQSGDLRDLTGTHTYRSSSNYKVTVTASTLFGSSTLATTHVTVQPLFARGHKLTRE